MRARNTTRRCARGWVLVLALGSPERTSAGLSTWTTGGPDGGTVRALAIDPVTPSTLHAGKGKGNGASRSINSGATWIDASTGLAGVSILAARGETSRD
jgi:hypothetical protein